ncbi:MAG: nucleoside phosphorylase [Planctomycetes bacterium]|nr:nucleoside phosphorylase [Planctomycetota bacterium]
MPEGLESAEVVRDASGRQYHVGVAPGEVAPNVLLVGDPARARRVAALFQAVELERANREYVTITGTWEGLRVSVVATGIGCDNTEIAVIELCQCVERPTFIRAGSSGSLQPHIGLGELVVSAAAVRLEDTSRHFVPDGYPAVAHHEVVLALLEAAAGLGVRHHLGLTATASGFYGAQGRTVGGFRPRRADLPEELGGLGVANLEMESSTLFTLASLRGVRAGTVCAVYAHRPSNVFIDAASKHRSEGDCIRTALAAFSVLARMDRSRGDGARWLPSMGLGPSS